MLCCPVEVIGASLVVSTFLQTVAEPWPLSGPICPGATKYRFSFAIEILLYQKDGFSFSWEDFRMPVPSSSSSSSLALWLEDLSLDISLSGVKPSGPLCYT